MTTPTNYQYSAGDIVFGTMARVVTVVEEVIPADESGAGEVQLLVEGGGCWRANEDVVLVKGILWDVLKADKLKLGNSLTMP